MNKIKNSDILFIYDAVNCNPNGDPDDENKPRMDYETQTNLVSDVRLKRYIRDYLLGLKDEKGNSKFEIFVAQVEGQTVDATNRLKKLIERYKDEIEKNNELKKDLIKKNKNKNDEPNENGLSKHLDWLLSKFIDVRLFGATMPIKASEGQGKGSSITFTGPVQFNWGYSLNKVQLVDSSTITSTFAGRGEDRSTMGKDWRVYYSLIAFHGIISAKRAEKTDLSKSDIEILDNALINAIPIEATTRSKIGQTPRFLIRIEYNDQNYFIGDLRRYVKIIPNEDKEIDNLRDVKDYKLDISELLEKIENNKNRVNKIYFWKNDDVILNNIDNLKNTLLEKLDNKDNKVIKLPHN